MSAISFEAELTMIGSWTILRLPESASAKLPSRGQVMVEGTINGNDLKTPLEPDGMGGHWFKIEKNMTDAKAGDTVEVQIEPTKNWPEPEVPVDWQKAVKASKKASEVWPGITPMARWEWVRWVRSTGNNETRKRRIDVGISKMESGWRRPCCWNRNLCTFPEVSKSGVLLDPAVA